MANEGETVQLNEKGSFLAVAEVMLSKLIWATSEKMLMSCCASSVPVAAITAEGVGDGLDQTGPPEK